MHLHIHTQAVVRIKTLQTTTLLKSTRILRRLGMTWSPMKTTSNYSGWWRKSIKYIIIKCSNLALKEYKRKRLDRVGTVIQWELCKQFRFVKLNQPSRCLITDTHFFLVLFTCVLIRVSVAHTHIYIRRHKGLLYVLPQLPCNSE